LLCVSKLANQRLAFTFTTLAICAAKGVHLHNHRSSVAPKRMLLFFFSFFTQDILLLLLIRLLLSHWVPSVPGKLRTLVNTLAFSLITYNAVLCTVSVSFYLVSGSEIHWRNIGFMADPTAQAIILSGLTAFIGVLCVCACLSAVLQVACYSLFGWGGDLVTWPITFICHKLGHRFGYDPLSQRDDLSWLDIESTSNHDKEFKGKFKSPSMSLLNSPRNPRGGSPVRRSRLGHFLRILPYPIVTLLLTALFILTFIRPKDPSLIFLSWTTGLLPFIDFASSPFLDNIPSVFGKGVQRSWDERTALAQPTPFSWLPMDIPALDGFKDWYLEKPHYSAKSDPMKISNLDEPLRDSLRGKLQDLNIRHVAVFFLESTRNDVFPVKKNGLIWNRFANTFPDKQLPQEVQEKFANLTPTANFITGDYSDGFEHINKPKRGGIHFTNAHTSGTYTLKSLTGTICGVAPLIADFNLDYSHHIYQPCLPHIFNALNEAEKKQAGTKEISQKDKWNSYFFQAAKLDYDSHGTLMSAMGFPDENIIGQEYLRSANAKHGAVTLENVNDFAFEEDPLEDYITDIFKDAATENSRVFLSHITSTSHHRFHLPKREKYTPMAKGLEMMSGYINTIGYDDRWIRKFLDILDKQGVANETLVIFQGDHGVSLPENDIASPYYNPNIGVEHVPLVLSHPQLPAFDVDEAVHATQILPTILDVLLETGSLSKTSRRAARDLIRNYEGQSLIRPLNKINKGTGEGQWQFTITNPGRAMLSIRDGRYPERHLVVPIIGNVDWKLADLTKDPHEHNLVQALDFKSFLQAVEERYGREVAEWAEEGAFMTRWFVKENSKRWRFDL
jgi:arylsulfatase A-like enzyme